MFNLVLDFWFTELAPAQWWQKNEALDQLISHKFSELHAQAKVGELYLWRDSPLGSLAEILILDQFSRNIYRDTPEAFACDSLALALAQVAIAKGVDKALPETQRSFMYLPYMHSESKLIHQVAVTLYESLGNSHYLAFEHKHKDIIDKFGRYPHRNTILGRQSTSAEISFLTQPDSGF